MDTTITSRLILLLSCLLTACSDGVHYAPVTDIDAIECVLKKRAVASIPVPKQTVEFAQTGSGFHWPARGQILQAYSASNKGIDIAGLYGSPIFATAAGQVVYCGNGLKAYGNLIILKHDRQYFSTYAHNHRVFVKEGDWVLQGQKIAEMGNSGARRTMLHFEIRHAGKPLNPVTLLSS